MGLICRKTVGGQPITRARQLTSEAVNRERMMVKVKKLLAGIGVCVVALSLSVGHLSATENSVVTVNASNVNLRSGPNLSNKVVELLQNGNKLAVLSHDGNWYNVTTSDNITGWVNDNFVSAASSADSSAASIGTVIGSNVNLRNDSSTSSKIIGTLQKGNKLDILSQNENWYKVKTSDGTIGWAISDYVSLTQSADNSSTSGTVTGSNVNLRNDSNTSSKIIGKLQKGNKIDVLTQGTYWYKVKTSDGTIGWVSNDFVSLGENATSSNTSKLASRGETTRSYSAHQEIIDYANQFLGVRYVWAGNSPSGFDCSGFTKYVFQHFGITLNRVAADQATQGAYVNKSNLTPGDLVFFDTDGGHNYINHVGIYIGNGMFIQSSSGAGKVVTANINEGFYANSYMTARRVMN